MTIKINAIINEGFEPKYANKGDAGADCMANILEPIVLEPGDYKIIPTGVKCAIPEGYEIQVRPRSGLAAKHGISVLNSPGTIDMGFRSEIGVILVNHGRAPFTVEPKMRIGQFVLNKFEQIEWSHVDSLDETERGLGGFGSSGM